MFQKKFLPYSWPLTQLLKSGFAPSNDVNVFIGMDALRKGKVFSISYPERTLVLPPWHDPEIYHWPIVDCDMLIKDTGYADDDYLNDMAYCLYQNGANIVRLITPDFKFIVFNK